MTERCPGCGSYRTYPADPITTILSYGCYKCGRTWKRWSIEAQMAAHKKTVGDRIAKHRASLDVHPESEVKNDAH